MEDVLQKLIKIKRVLTAISIEMMRWESHREKSGYKVGGYMGTWVHAGVEYIGVPYIWSTSDMLDVGTAHVLFTVLLSSYPPLAFTFEQESAAGNAWQGLQLLNAAKQHEANGNHDAAERSYSHALERVAHPDVLASFANFLQTVRGDYDRAESMFQLSLKSDPTHLDTLQFYAIFLEEVRDDLDAAERLYSVALASTRDGLLNEIETPKVQGPDAEHEAYQSNPTRFLPPTLSPKNGESQPLAPYPEQDLKKSSNKICKRFSENEKNDTQVRLRQSPKRESLKQHLKHGASDIATSGAHLDTHLCRFYT